ncbi:MAG: isoprenylcysteine carboxyl methyltransferase [Zetaproteobacteria bacterium]|nr:isoprenylcysteine carboxyl methyltransferase [Zetaproteobacteria bacterium]
MSPLSWLGLFILCILIERVYELKISRQNAAVILAQGGIEVGREHFPYMVALHFLFFVAIPVEVVVWETPFSPYYAMGVVMLVVGTMALRYWAIRSLGLLWNTRVLVLPGRPAVQKGPFKWIRHPNYLAVILELAVIPLFHGAWRTAVIFSCLNLWMLRTRIAVEEHALREHCAYADAFAEKHAFVP